MAKAKVVKLKKVAKAKGLLNKKRTKLDINKSNVANLKEQLAMTFELIPIAEKRYKELPSDRNCYALTKLIETAVGLMEKIEEIDKSSMVNAVDEQVLRPLTQEVVMSLAKELRRLRETIKQSANPDIVPKETEATLRRVGEKLDESYKKAIENLEKILKLT